MTTPETGDVKIEDKAEPQIQDQGNRYDEEFWESDEEHPLTSPMPVSGLEPEVEPLPTKFSSASTFGIDNTPASLLTSFPLTSLWSAFWNSGVTCMAFASSIQSLSALLVKLTDGRVPIFEIVAVRSMLCMIATAILIKLKGQPLLGILGGRKYLLAKFIRGFGGAASMTAYYYGIFILSLSDSVTIFFTHPAMIVVLAWVVKGEAVRWPGLVGVLLAMIGVVLVSQPSFLTGGETWSMRHIEGVLACLLGALLAAIAFTAIRFIPKSEPSVCVAAWFHLMGVIFGVFPLLVGIPSWPVLPSWSDAICVLGVGFCSFSSHAFIARALQIETAAKASAAGYLQVVFAYVYGLAFLGEGIELLSIGGSAVICLGVIATSWPRKQEAQNILPVTDEKVESSQIDSLGGRDSELELIKDVSSAKV